MLCSSATIERLVGEAFRATQDYCRGARIEGSDSHAVCRQVGEYFFNQLPLEISKILELRISYDGLGKRLHIDVLQLPICVECPALSIVWGGEA